MFFHIFILIVMCCKPAEIDPVLVKNTTVNYKLIHEEFGINSKADCINLNMHTVFKKILNFNSFENLINRNTAIETEERIFLNDVSQKYRFKSDKFRQKLNDNSSEIKFNMKEKGDKTSFDKIARENAFTLTTPKETPYSVLLLVETNSTETNTCTGSLLTPEWVLTAAHCLQSKTGNTVTKVFIYAGGNSLQEVITSNRAPEAQLKFSRTFFLHPIFKDEGDTDIGLVKTEEKFNLSRTVNTVKLSSSPWTYPSYHKCNFTGFGRVQVGITSAGDNKRKTHSLRVKNPCLCSDKFGEILGSKVVKRYICSEPKEDYGVCGGDSGGGLICDGELKGVVMHVIALKSKGPCEREEEFSSCGSENAVSVFQDSCPFVRWINGYVKLYNDSEISWKCVYNGENSSTKMGLNGAVVKICKTLMCLLAVIITLLS